MHDLLENYNLNDTAFTFTMSNPGSKTIEFYPKTIVTGGEYVMHSPDSLYAWVLRGVTSLDSTLRKREALDRVGYLLKSPYFRNRKLIFFSPIPEINEKKYAPVGSLHNFHTQCGEYCEMAKKILLATEIFAYHELRPAWLQNHVAMEVLIDGKWVLYDPDPGMPWMTDYVSSADSIQSNSNFFDGKTKYLHDGVDISPWINLERYHTFICYPVTGANDQSLPLLEPFAKPHHRFCYIIG